MQIPLDWSGGGDAGRGGARLEDLAERAFLREVMQRTGEAVCVTDLDDRLLSVNDSFLQLYGYADEELIGRSVGLVLSPRVCSSTVETVRATTARGVGWQGELWNRKKDGTEFPVHLATTPVVDEDGRTVALVSVIKDVSARKRVEDVRSSDVDCLLRIHELGVGLASLPSSADLFEFLATSLKALTGAVVVSVGEYRPEHRDIVIRWIDADQTALKLAKEVVGVDARETVSKVDDQTYRTMLSTRVSVRHSLADVTYGAITPAVAAFLQQLLGLHHFVRLAYVFEGMLYGTSVLAFAEGTPLPPTVLLDAFGSLAAVSLRRREAERKLHLSNARLRGITNSLPGVAFRCCVRDNGEIGLHYASEAGEKLLGLPADPRADRLERFSACILPEDRAAFHASVNAAIAGKCAWQFEGRFVKPTGEVLWLKGSAQPRQVDHELVFDGLLLDVTERMRADDALREHRGMVDAIVETSQDWIWAMGVDGRHTYCNPAVEQILGYRPEEIIGLGLELLHEEDRPRLDQVWREAVASRRGWTNVCARWRCHDGRYRILESNAVPIISPTGALIGFRGVDRDISERTKAAGDLAEWKRRYDRLSLAARNIVYDYNPTSGDIDVGGSVEETLGYTSSELAGGIEQWQTLIHPDERDAISRRYFEAQTGGTVFHAEYRCRHRQGRYLLMEDTGYPLFDEAGRVEHYIGVVVDITERRKADAERMRLEEQLRQSQKMESIGRLAGGVAHDFNNLLTVINGYTDLMMYGLKSADPLHSNLEQVRKAGTRAAALTQQLLAFSRKQVLRPRPLSLDRCVSDMQPMLARLLGEDVELRVALNAAGVVIHADPHQIEQVIMNLVVNSRDAMPRGGTLAIETAVIDSNALSPSPGVHLNRCVKLAITDNGVGMDEKTSQRIFEPFFTTKPAGKGTGLGLSMVQGIVAQSGGSIEVESEPGRGTTFRIHLPTVEELDAATLDVQPKRSALVGRETILVVEDEPDVRDYTATALRAYGYRVVTAENAGTALVIHERRQEPVDLLVTDVVMPNMSGGELVERLRVLNPGLRVLFMSGYTDDVIVHHGVHEHGAGFIQKPFSPEQLATQVREVLSRPPGSPAASS